ncbi:MAG: hypothetical protein D6790_00830 [Caldilineae bacterium]|nr:MAG: hypothetical protein D6790_00830 [Caldilineae bacterium]
MRTHLDDPMQPYAHELAAQWAARGRINVKVQCPLCSSTRRKSSERCLSITVKEGKLLYHCHHCDARGACPLDEQVHAYDRDEGPQELPPIDMDEYGYPHSSHASMQWLLGRLPDEVVRYVRQHMVDEGLTLKHAFAFDRRGNIVFPMTRRDGTIVNVQTRTVPDKRFFMMSGRPITFYLGCLMGRHKTIVITEGQIDALSVMYAVRRADMDVVSLPNGAANLRFDPDAWAFVAQHYDKVIIATDADAPGREAAQAIARRIGFHKCLTVNWPDGCKDANDVLIKHGADMLASLVANATPNPVEGVLTVNAMISHITDRMTTWPDHQRARTGMGTFDDMITFARGEVVIITGIPGHGKSTFIDQVAVGLARHNGWHGAFLSFEKYDHAMHALELAEKYISKPMIGTWSKEWEELHDPSERASTTEVEQALAFVDDHFVFFDVTSEHAVYMIEDIYDKLLDVHVAHNVDFFVLDNLSFVSSKERDENKSVKTIINKLLLFAQRYNMCIFVVAHPRKPPVGFPDNYIPKGYNISGTADIFNKAHIGLTVYREPESGLTTVYKWKQRDRFSGNRNIEQVTFAFVKETCSFVEVKDDDMVQVDW